MSIILNPNREKSLLRRHPWIFAGAVHHVDHDPVDGTPASGATIDLISSEGHFLARASYSPISQIRARVWTFEDEPVGKEFFRKAVAMGFHVLPHFPALDMDPTHPSYNSLRDFQYRELENHKIVGWTQRGEGPVPESNQDRVRHQGFRVNMRMHPGLSMWRSLLAENIAKTLEVMPVDSVFLDVTMNIHNVSNGLVENSPPTLGMVLLMETIRSLGKGLTLTGEGRNEITMQRQVFGQVHLFKSWRENFPGLERLKPIHLGEFLFGPWCRSFGYARLSGQEAWEPMRMRLHVDMGAVPTITIRSAAEIDNPNPAVAEMLALAVK